MQQQGHINGLTPAQHHVPTPRLLLGSCRGLRPTQLRGPTPALSPRHDVSNAASRQAADRPMTRNSSAQSAPTDLTELAGYTLTHGNGVARRVLSDPHLEGAPLDFLKQTEAYWKALKQQKHEPHKPGPTVITTSNSTISSLLQDSSGPHSSSSSSTDAATPQPQPRPPSFGAAPAGTAAAAASGSHSRPAGAAAAAAAAAAQSSSPDFDVVMCGGTLGICVALALQQQGYRVAVVERRRVEGRLQEWNSSRHEMQVLVDLGLLTAAELEAAIVSEFNPIRVGFKGGSKPITVNDVLNIGVCPKTLIATLRSKFEVLGGVVYEHTAFKSGVVGSDGVVVSLGHTAGAPADVGDTNRPNALQEQQQQQVSPLHSPFGRVAGSAGSAAAAAAATAGVTHSNSNAARHSSSSSGGSGYERWLAAAGSNGWLDSSSHATHTQQAAPDQHSISNGSHMQQQAPAQQHSRSPAAAAVNQGSSSSSRRAPSKLTCRLLLDCMGHYSPIVKQLRGRAKPDGVVVVVGGCATGFAPEANTSADLLYSFTDAAADMQLFWEAFPAEGGAFRTTYMFAYTDADPGRPNFEKLLDTYFTLMPAYQGLTSLESVKFKRVLFGGFPCYSSTNPLTPGFDRVLQLGDASASQSPLSFGGFGSMLRHLGRLSGAVGHALREDRLSRQDLAWVHPYQPSLSAAWLFQRSMSVQVGQTQQQLQQQQSAPLAAAAADAAAAPAAATATTSSSGSSQPSSAWWRQLLLLPGSHINALLGANFTAMAILGQRVMKPFLQDTLQLGPLAAAMCGMMLLKPLVIARVFVQVGPKVLLGWFGHFTMLAAYTLTHHLLKPLRHVSSSYTWCRLLDALKFGSSSDYHYSSSSSDGVRAGVVSSGSGSKVAAPQGERVGVDAGRVAPVGAVANNIVPAVPSGIWGQHEVVHSNSKGSQQQQQQQQPSAA